MIALQLRRTAVCGTARFLFFGMEEEWNRQEMRAYARQASFVAEHVLMVNPIDHDPQNHGGAFYFCGGEIMDRLPFDQEGILIVDIDDAV